MPNELFFHFYPSRFMAGIRGLNANEVKVYISLICRIYEHNGPIPWKPEILATYCEMRQSSFDKALDRLLRLEKLYVTDDGRLSNATCDAEISQRESKSKIARRAGKKSAEKRQENQGSEATGVQRPFNQWEGEGEEREVAYAPSLSCVTASGDASDTDSPPDEDSAGGAKRPPTPSRSARRAAEIDEAFEAFWAAYPHRGGVKKGKAPARKKWHAAIRSGADPAQIIAAAEAHHGDRRVIDGYARDPATWINQRGWEDEIEPPRAPQHGGFNAGQKPGRRAVASREVGLAAQRLFAASTGKPQ